jgi:TP901 family phage tail tape measure protein
MADTAYLGIEVDSSGLRKGGRDLDTFATKGKQTGDKVNKSTGLMTRGFNSVKNSIAATLLATAGLGVAIMTIANFESSVSKMGAVSRATTVELAAMRDIAQEFGSATEFSATQAADGLTFLAMAGFSASESIAALPAVLDLATASGMGLAAAADTASNIMSGFGVAATQAADVADLLAAASSRANTDVAQLGDAMKFVGPVASALGIEMSDAAAAIGVLSDAGIQGGMAGTSLRQVLSGLVNPTGAAKTAIQGLGLTVDEISPQTNNLVDIIAKFADAGVTASDAMTILGDRGGPALLALTSQSDSLRELSGELGDVEGEAARMAETFRDNLGGDIKGAQSAAQGLILALGDAGLTAILRGVIGVITDLTRFVTGLVNGFANITDAIGSMLGFAGANDIIAQAAASAAVAMQVETEIASGLMEGLNTGQTVSIDYAGVKLAQARAHLAVADAIRQETIASIRSSGEFQKQAELQRSAQTDLAAYYQFRAEAAAQGEIEGARDAENFRDIVAQLQRASRLQQEMLATVGDTSAEYQALQADIAVMQVQIDEAVDGVVTFGGETGNAATIAERLANVAAGINFEGAISDAQSLANFLQISLSAALQLNATTPMMSDEDAAMSMQVTPDAGMRDAQRNAVENFKALTEAAGSVEGGGAAGALKRSADAMARQISALEDSADPMRVFNRGMAELDEMKLLGLSDGAYAKGVEDLTKEMNDGQKVAKSFADTLKENVEGAVTGVSDAFANLVMRGLKDFASFANSVVDTFKNMLIKMISMAAQNQIMISLGMSGGGGVGGLTGGGGAGSALMSGAGAALGGGGSLVGVTGLMGGLGAGAGMAASGLMGGGLAGMTGAITAQVGAATAAGASMAAMGAAIGAIALPVAAVLAVVSFFRTKTKTIDSGIRATIDMEDAMFESFKEIEKSRFWGLSKKRSTSFNELTGADSAPLDDAVFAIRESVIGATESLGVSSDVFNGFSHKFELSLKGLDEAARASAISEEFTKMGDSLAGLVPHIDNMNQLFAVAANRVSLTDRLLQAQGKTEELTTRIREREMAVTSELNQVLLASVFAAEDAAAAQAALANDSFTTLQEAMFAATSGGYRTPTDEIAAAAEADREILREIVVAVRTGNVNTARLLTEQLANAERDELNPEVVT